MFEFLLTTKTGLFLLNINRDFDVINHKILLSSEESFFGISQYNDNYYISSTSYKTNNSYIINSILQLNKNFEVIRVYSFGNEPYKLHQIRVTKYGIWAITLCGKIFILDHETGYIKKFLDISIGLPQKEKTYNCIKDDIYHFNSISFSDNYLYCLAHNHGEGSFYVKIDMVSGNKEVCYVDAICAHDIIEYNGKIIVNDSVRNKININGDLYRHSLSDHFLRGISLVSDKFLVCGAGIIAEREKRYLSPTYIYIFDMKNKKTIKSIKLGNYGDTADILLISDYDASDKKHSDIQSIF